MKRLIDRHDPFWSQILKLVFPIMIQSFMLALVSATDAIMLGLIDQDSMSSVSLATQVQFVFNLFVSAMAIGVGIIAAQYWGKKDGATIERFIPIALRINVLCGCLFSAAAFLIPDKLMLIFTNEQELITRGAGYLRMVAPSYLLCGISQIYLAVLKNTGCAPVSSRISSSAVIVNIVFNSLLIFGLLGLPRMEIRGAALATVLARLWELLWALWENKKPGRIRVLWRSFLKQ